MFSLIAYPDLLSKIFQTQLTNFPKLEYQEVYFKSNSIEHRLYFTDEFIMMMITKTISIIVAATVY